MLALAIWDTIKHGLGYALAFFYGIIPNAGVAIILLTVAIRLALFPLTAKQAKSMIAMQRVQPEIKKLQAKYKNDRQKLNEEMMKFYKENEINPLGGCLPLVLQMPVFIAPYQTLRTISTSIPVDSKMYADICGASTKALACKPTMDFLGMNLTTSASQAVNKAGATFTDYAPYLVLVALVLVTGYFQQRQTMRNQTTPNPQMAIISKVFPIVFGFISWGIPSGVVLYFFTSNLWQIGQQEVVLRTVGSAAGPPRKKGAKALEEGAGSGPDRGHRRRAETIGRQRETEGHLVETLDPETGDRETGDGQTLEQWHGQDRREIRWKDRRNRKRKRADARYRRCPQQPKAKAIDGVGTDDGTHRRRSTRCCTRRTRCSSGRRGSPKSSISRKPDCSAGSVGARRASESGSSRSPEKSRKTADGASPRAVDVGARPGRSASAPAANRNHNSSRSRATKGHDPWTRATCRSRTRQPPPKSS